MSPDCDAVIEVLKHGWLDTAEKVYFIDPEIVPNSNAWALRGQPARDRIE